MHNDSTWIPHTSIHTVNVGICRSDMSSSFTVQTLKETGSVGGYGIKLELEK